MFYREAGQFKTNYAADVAVFPILQDRIGLGIILFIAAVIIPWFGSSFLIQAVMIPFLIFSLAAIGLNLLTGYTGLLSLGTGAFMGVGAYACYKLTTYFPNVNIIIWIAASGFFSAAIGVLFGLPSLRIKGFYLAVATLAAQFFLSWCFIRQPWFYNYNVSGAIEVPTRSLFGVPITGATATDTTRYFVVLGFVVVMTWAASNLVHGRIGRMWMAVRDMDLAAELTGIRLLPTKLLAFATSSFYCGVAGALLVFLWYGGAEPAVFDVNLSFFILFMVIIGGLGSLTGSFFGAALIFIMPIVLRYFPPKLGIPIHPATVEHIQYMVIGALIILFLIAEPAGLARLWQIGKQKLRVWPSHTEEAQSRPTPRNTGTAAAPSHWPRNNRRHGRLDKREGGRQDAIVPWPARNRCCGYRRAVVRAGYGERRRQYFRSIAVVSHRTVRGFGRADHERHGRLS